MPSASRSRSAGRISAWATSVAPVGTMSMIGSPGATTPSMVATFSPTTTPATGARSSARRRRSSTAFSAGAISASRAETSDSSCEIAAMCWVEVSARCIRVSASAARASASRATSAARAPPIPANSRSRSRRATRLSTPRSDSSRAAVASCSTSVNCASMPSSSASIASVLAASRASAPSIMLSFAARSSARAAYSACWLATAEESESRSLETSPEKSGGASSSSARRRSARAALKSRSAIRLARSACHAVASSRSSGSPASTTCPSVTRISETMPPSRCWIVLRSPSTTILPSASTALESGACAVQAATPSAHKIRIAPAATSGRPMPSREPGVMVIGPFLSIARPAPGPGRRSAATGGASRSARRRDPPAPRWRPPTAA